MKERERDGGDMQKGSPHRFKQRTYDCMVKVLSILVTKAPHIVQYILYTVTQISTLVSSQPNLAQFKAISSMCLFTCK